jgi:hypothetical protein
VPIAKGKKSAVKEKVVEKVKQKEKGKGRGRAEEEEEEEEDARSIGEVLSRLKNKKDKLGRAYHIVSCHVMSCRVVSCHVI